MVPISEAPSVSPTIVPTNPPSITPIALPSNIPTLSLLRPSSSLSSTPSMNPTFVSSGNVHVNYYEFIGQTSLPADGLKSLTPYAESHVKNIDFRPGSGTFATSGREDNVAALFEGEFSQAIAYYGLTKYCC